MTRLPDNGDSLWEILIEQYYHRTAKVIYSLIKDKYLAEDITQEAFIKAIDKFEQLKDPDRFYQWLLSIAVNLCKKELKQRQKESVGFSAYETTQYDLNFKLPLDLAVEKETQAILKNSINQLSYQERKVIILRYYTEMRINEIAAYLGLSVGTVKNYLYRARIKLYQDLKSFYDKEGDIDV